MRERRKKRKKGRIRMKGKRKERKKKKERKKQNERKKQTETKISLMSLKSPAARDPRECLPCKMYQTLRLESRISLATRLP